MCLAPFYFATEKRRLRPPVQKFHHTFLVRSNPYFLLLGSVDPHTHVLCDFLAYGLHPLHFAPHPAPYNGYSPHVSIAP